MSLSVLVDYKSGNALMVRSLILSVVLFRFRGLNVVVVGVLVFARHGIMTLCQRVQA